VPCLSAERDKLGVSLPAFHRAGLDLANLSAYYYTQQYHDLAACHQEVPDLPLYLDISAEEGLRRRQEAAEHGAEWNRLDAESLEFHRRVREGYLALIAEAPARWITFSALGTPEAIHTQICAALTGRGVIRPL